MSELAAARTWAGGRLGRSLQAVRASGRAARRSTRMARTRGAGLRRSTRGRRRRWRWLGAAHGGGSTGARRGSGHHQQQQRGALGGWSRGVVLRRDGGTSLWRGQGVLGCRRACMQHAAGHAVWGSSCRQTSSSQGQGTRSAREGSGGARPAGGCGARGAGEGEGQRGHAGMQPQTTEPTAPRAMGQRASGEGEALEGARGGGGEGHNGACTTRPRQQT